MIDPAYIVGGGGIVAAIAAAVVAFRKSGPESSQILVDAAKDVVVIQKAAIDRLEATMRQLGDRVEGLDARLRATVTERDRLALENERLRGQVAGLERRVKELELHQSDNGKETP